MYNMKAKLYAAIRQKGFDEAFAYRFVRWFSSVGDIRDIHIPDFVTYAVECQYKLAVRDGRDYIHIFGGGYDGIFSLKDDSMSNDYNSVQSELEYQLSEKARDFSTAVLCRFVDWIKEGKDCSRSAFDAAFAFDFECPELQQLQDLVDTGELCEPQISVAADIVTGVLNGVIQERQEAHKNMEFTVHVFNLEADSHEEALQLQKDIQFELDRMEENFSWSMQVSNDSEGWILEVTGSEIVSLYDETIAEAVDAVKTAYIKYFLNWMHTDAHHRGPLAEVW